MLNIMVKVVLSEPSLRLGGKEGDKYAMVILRGDASVAAGSVGCARLLDPAAFAGAQFPHAVNVDFCEWPDFSASRMKARDLELDSIYEMCSGLFAGTELLLQCELVQRDGDRGRKILGINIVDALVLAYPPQELIEAQRKPSLLASLHSAARNGRPASAPAAPASDKK